MKNYTVVYHSENNEGLKAFHVVNATTERLQKAFNEAKIRMIDHIIEQYTSIGIIEFKPIMNEQDISNFIKEWKLDY